MRVVRVLVPDDRLSTVRDRLDDEGVDHLVLAQNEAADRSLVEFPIPAEGVDFVLDELRDAGVDDEYVVVLGAETVATTHYDDLERRFVAEQEEGDAIATEEIRSKAVGMTPNARTYYAMTLLSAVVATAGLLLDSPAIVVGSMVIAPQVGSAMAASVGAAVGDRRLLLAGLRSQVLGLALAICAATAFGLGLKTAAFVPPSLNVDTVTQIASRISPGFLSIAVGLCAGAAGAFGLATAVPVSLVGVMIAAALIPAAAATGIGVAWGFPLVAVGAFVLLAANAVAINLAALGTFAFLGYRPEGGARDLLASDPVVPAVLVVLVVAFAVLGGATARHATVENAVNDAVGEVLDREPYEPLGLVSVRVGFSPATELTGEQPVTVVVSRPADVPYPALADAIRRAVADSVAGPVAVTVEYVEQVETERSAVAPRGRVVERDRPERSPGARLRSRRLGTRLTRAASNGRRVCVPRTRDSPSSSPGSPS
ncbi:TIGR00341 family protein [Halorubellus sp. PRR65]|uniref:TIGR00341 family protein n=1 Tax=Halorubellus sp. PRR65 TaxID=3098148 RepID=UPI002B262DD9|nr:TIGR00341 family protein [Halorubellus sp. PRR65]